MEEVWPDRFLLRNPGLRPLIKSEGRFNGHWFDLTSWRREGMLARLRESGFVVRSLADQVAALPDLPAATMPAAPVTRPLRRNERYSVFDTAGLDWVALQPRESPAGPVVMPREGEILRLRQGRGPARFYRVGADRNAMAMLIPLDETAALLHGYAQASCRGEVGLPMQKIGQHTVLRRVPPLPAPHRELLERLSSTRGRGCRVDPVALPYVQNLFAKLGLTLFENHHDEKE